MTKYPKNRIKQTKKLFYKYLYKNTPYSYNFMKYICNNNYNNSANELYNLYTMISNDKCISSNPNLVVRIVATTADGHVYFDSRKGLPDSSLVANGKNNYVSWVVTPPLTGSLSSTISGLAISENHNTRNSFIDANNSKKGKGEEIKPALNSNKQPILECRYAHRYGNTVEKFGVFALSIEEPLLC
jgi:hypothetical protein